MTQQAIQLLKQLIATPSASREEGAAADFLQAHIEELGYLCNRLGNNVWIMSPGFDLNKPTILLNSHIDTVRPAQGWTIDPFTPIEKNGKLYGLGSNDAGASLVSLLHVFFALTEKEQAYNLIFAASAEEEISGTNGMEILVKELPKIDVAIVGEPTNMQAAIAEKGLLVLDCTVFGKSGHAARNEGENAIYKAMPIIEQLKNYRFSKVSDLLGEVNVNVTMISAGVQHNVVPDRCDFTVDIRFTECYTNKEILAEIQSQADCEVKARSLRLKSSSIDRKNPFVLRCKEMGLQMYGSPTMSDQTFMHFPSLKIGPGSSARSHTTDEFVYLSEIDEAIRVYMELLDGFSF